MIWKNEDKKPVYIGINTNLKGSSNSVKFLCNAWRQLITGHVIEKYDNFVGITEAKPICDYKKTYLIVDNDYRIIESGKIISSKINSRGMFVVTEKLVLSTDKKALFDYYKNAAHGMISWWEENKKTLNKAMLEVEVKDNYTYNNVKSYQDRICKVSSIIGALKDEYRIVANTIKSL
jgi:hypothetical protein